MLGNATANPNHGGDIENALWNHENRGFIGIKPYAVLHGKLTDAAYAPWLEYGDRRHMFVKVHSGNQDIADQVDELAPKYPNIIFLMAHSGAGMTAARINTALAKKHDNVVLEITYTSATRGSIEYMVSEIGSERVLYGSDLPMRDPAPQLAWVAYAEISLEDKINILGENMKKIVDRVLPPEIMM
jgi:predicted TIM-barrel fold metal-dependent hydrolase